MTTTIRLWTKNFYYYSYDLGVSYYVMFALWHVSSVRDFFAPYAQTWTLG